MVSKAYWVSVGDGDEESILTFAETAGKAKASCVCDLGDDFIHLHAKREPKADIWAEKGCVPEAWGLQNGIYGWVECGGTKSHICYQKLSPDEDTFFYNDRAYCLNCYVEEVLQGQYPAGTHCLWNPYVPMSRRGDDQRIYCYDDDFLKGLNDG